MLRLSRILSMFILVASSTLAGAMSLGTPAGATTTTLSIICKSLTGKTTNVTLLLSQCSGNTLGAGSIDTAGLTPPGGSATITWANNHTTTVNVAVCSPEGCNPGGKSVDPTNDSGGSCPAGTTEREVRGTVTSDSTGSASVGGVVTAEACVDSSGNVTKERGTRVKI